MGCQGTRGLVDPAAAKSLLPASQATELSRLTHGFQPKHPKTSTIYYASEPCGTKGLTILDLHAASLAFHTTNQNNNAMTYFSIFDPYHPQLQPKVKR